MTELVVIAGAVGGYVLYRKWKAAREYNRRLEPKIPPSREEIEGVADFLRERSIASHIALYGPFSIYSLGEDSD